MPIFENKQVTEIAKSLDVTKAELDTFITKTANTVDSLERMIAREHGSNTTYASLIKDY